jgi:hypothetical protein
MWLRIESDCVFHRARSFAGTHGALKRVRRCSAFHVDITSIPQHESHKEILCKKFNCGGALAWAYYP